ncbi:MAG: hypothetical protein OHK0013_44320 [Sandaracinaceae bacterium]
MDPMVDADGPGEEREGSRFDLGVAVASGLASVALVLGILVVEQIRVTHEIQVWAPERAQVGDPVPVRAIVLTDLDGPGGPRLVTEGVSAMLGGTNAWDESSAVVLTGDALGTVQGRVGPAEAAFDRVLARVRAESELLATAERSVTVEERVETPLAVRERLGDALQVLELSHTDAVRTVAPELQVRVEGGVCVPDVPCTLRFFRGEAAIVPRLVECTSTDVTRTAVGRAVVAVTVVVHGPEARCRVMLDPSEVATDLQIPVGLATPWLDAEVRGDTLRVRAEPPIGRDAVLLDVFVGERWVDARSVARGETLELAIEPLGSGIVRLQARTDVASSERAYQRALVVAPPDAPSGSELVERAWRERFGEDAARWDAERRAFELCALEAALVDVPAPSSGLARDEARLATTRTTMRWVASSGVALAVVVMLAAVGRRGLAATRQARAVLRDAGVQGADDRAARWRSALTVVGFVAAIGVAIALGAAFLVARPFFLG